jgi:micrococcal nuclease
MQNLIALLVVGVAVSQNALGSRSPVSGPLLVRSVVDGDTIDVVGVGRVRLLGVAAPKAGPRVDTPPPFAREARERLVALVGNRWVRLEREALNASTRGAYVVREDGLFVNAAMVRDGLARVTARTAIRRIDELRRAEDDARSFRRGMWGAAPDLPLAGYTPQSAGTRSPSHKTKKPRTR